MMTESCAALPFLLVVTVLPLAHSFLTSTPVSLFTTHGEVNGVRRSVGANLPNVETYYGIPFAEPPTGDRRFRSPVPKGHWNEPIDGTARPKACWQVNDTAFNRFPGVEMWNSNTGVDEDCLYLNVWRPEPTSGSILGSGDGDTRSSSTHRHKTILVWIFGGGFYSGSALLDVYNPSQLVANEDVIVITIGYRVGVFGFLYLGNDDVPGNAGLLDQAMALQWVKDNAVHLGGSPDDITIFGESAGAVSVGLHLLSPVSRDLFTNAIMQSSTPLADWAVMENSKALERAIVVGKNVNCPEVVNENFDELLVCLKDADASDLVNLQWYVENGWFGVTFVPVVDGVFLPDTPQNMIAAGNIKLTNVIAGVNKDEGIYFDLYGFLDVFSNLSRNGHMNEAEFQRIMLSVAEKSPSFKDELINAYSNEGDGSHLDIVDATSGDYLFKCSVVDFAREYTRLGGNVYMYSFEEDFSSNPWPDWMGVPHGYEIEVIFGAPVAHNSNNTQAEKNLSLKMMDLWATFARTGSPNSIGQDEWPVYTTDNAEYVIIDHDGMHTQQHLRKEQCEIWANRNSQRPAVPLSPMGSMGDIQGDQPPENMYLNQILVGTAPLAPVDNSNQVDEEGSAQFIQDSIAPELLANSQINNEGNPLDQLSSQFAQVDNTQVDPVPDTQFEQMNRIPIDEMVNSNLDLEGSTLVDQVGSQIDQINTLSIDELPVEPAVRVDSLQQDQDSPQDDQIDNAQINQGSSGYNSQLDSSLDQAGTPVGQTDILEVNQLQKEPIVQMDSSLDQAGTPVGQTEILHEDQPHNEPIAQVDSLLEQAGTPVGQTEILQVDQLHSEPIAQVDSSLDQAGTPVGQTEILQVDQLHSEPIAQVDSLLDQAGTPVGETGILQDDQLHNEPIAQVDSLLDQAGTPVGQTEILQVDQLHSEPIAQVDSLLDQAGTPIGQTGILQDDQLHNEPIAQVDSLFDQAGTPVGQTGILQVDQLHSEPIAQVDSLLDQAGTPVDRVNNAQSDQLRHNEQVYQVDNLFDQDITQVNQEESTQGDRGQAGETDNGQLQQDHIQVYHEDSTHINQVDSGQTGQVDQVDPFQLDQLNNTHSDQVNNSVSNQYENSLPRQVDNTHNDHVNNIDHAQIPAEREPSSPGERGQHLSNASLLEEVNSTLVQQLDSTHHEQLDSTHHEQTSNVLDESHLPIGYDVLEQDLLNVSRGGQVNAVRDIDGQDVLVDGVVVL